MTSFKLFNSHLFVKSWKPRPVLASPIPTPAHLQSKNEQVRVWILIHFSQDGELHWAGSRLSLWYSPSAWHTRTLSNIYWVNECHHKVSGKEGNVREPKWPKLQNQQPQSLFLPISIPERPHLHRFLTHWTNIYGTASTCQQDWRRTGWTDQALCSSVFMERDIQSVLPGQGTFNGMTEMRQGRQCWSLLQSVVEEGLSGGDTEAMTGRNWGSAPHGQWGKEYFRQRERKRLWRAGFGWAQEGRAGLRLWRALWPTVTSGDLNSRRTGMPLECSE